MKITGNMDRHPVVVAHDRLKPLFLYTIHAKKTEEHFCKVMCISLFFVWPPSIITPTD